MNPLTIESQHFLILCETQNITMASEIIGIGQAGISKSLKRLEQAAGVKLFLRIGRGLSLTEHGSNLQKKLLAMQEVWNVNQLDSNGSGIKISGNYSLGIHTTNAFLGLQHCYARLTEENPDFNLRLLFMNSHDITRAVIQNSIDFGIVTNPAPYPDLVVKKLRKDHVAIYGVKGKSLKKIIYYNPNMNQCAKILQKFKDYKHIRIEDYEVLAQMSIYSQSLVLLPGPVAAKYPQLQQRGDKLALVDIALIYRADRPKTYTFKFVVDELLQAYYTDK